MLYENLTLESIENLNLNQIYATFMHISSVITTFLYAIMMFTIIYKSNKDMELFRNIIGLQISCSYAFDLALNSFQLVPLMPFYVSIQFFQTAQKQGFSLSLYPEINNLQ